MSAVAIALPPDGRQSPAALALQRGACRVLRRHGLMAIAEFALPNGRRADLAAIGPKGEIWIVEIKSSPADFQVDRKWPEYRACCDRLLFAVGPAFPIESLPEDTGLIVADRFGGVILREAPEHRLAATARRTMTHLLARAAAARLMGALDPESGEPEFA